jgi:hypothetical protein
MRLRLQHECVTLPLVLIGQTRRETRLRKAGSAEPWDKVSGRDRRFAGDITRMELFVVLKFGEVS